MVTKLNATNKALFLVLSPAITNFPCRMIKLSSSPYYILLLPLFFVLHTLYENYVPILVPVAVLLAFIYLSIACVLTGLFWFFYRDWQKAAIAALAILSIQFFFGSFHDFLRANLSNSFVTKYSFLLPLFGILLTLLFFWLKKKKSPLITQSRFLNLLLIVLIIIELVGFIPKTFKNQPYLVRNIATNIVPENDRNLPDIHLIIADEYAGNVALNELFSYDNSNFLTELKARGFYISDSSISNYNATVYSMASIFNMDYIGNLESRVVNHRDMLRCRGLINNNAFIRYLENYNYSFYNHSYFELDGQEKLVHNPFYPTKQALFTAQTFTSRFRRNLGFHFASEKKIQDIVKHHLYNNKTIEEATRKLVIQKSNTPRFIYTHLAMPHHPYYFDSTGRELPFEQLTEHQKNDRNAYISYLVYTNKRLLALIDHIFQQASSPPIIILLSDHGFRQLPPDVDRKYFFMNLIAVLLPGKDYSRFKPMMSNVNVIRSVLNSTFNQQLPMLPDSTIFYEEPQLDF
jgi:hypothetical protein